jgi:non-ribosomal peptide synthetase-like protein
VAGVTGIAAPPRLVGALRRDFLRDELLPEIFQVSAKRFSGRTALRCRGEGLSYREVQRRALRVAHHLRSLGIGKNTRVAVWMEPGFEIQIAILGILNAGAAYVPIDPQCPAERAAYLVSDSGAAALIASQTLPSLPELGGCRRIVFEREAAFHAGGDLPALSRAETGARPDDCAYIIYTSGSTGRPKGVMISHRSICHFIRAEGSILGLRRGDLVFQGSSPAFDMSLEEIWPAWAAGATLLIGTAEVLRGGSDLAPWLAGQGVTVWTCVPTLLAMQDSFIPTLRLLNLGGEACPPELVRRWARAGLRLLNTYGPTEATITATYAVLATNRPVTIGRPLPNYTAWVLDERLAPVAEGGVGELCIGGPGLALGYAGRPDLTTERFVPNPQHAPGGLDPVLYRTGDLARFGPGGEIEFLGRIDTQVKIRGFRIELSEIESVLLATGSLRQASVTVWRDARGDPKLIAYVVPRGDLVYDEAALRARLKALLPAYMVPAIFEPLADLPRQASGKVDPGALPPPTHAAAAERVIVLPGTETERTLHAVWSGLFTPATVSIDDDFFLDLGGDSLSAAELVSALRLDPALRHVSMGDVYGRPTLRGLAAHLEASHPANERSRPAIEHADASAWRHVFCGLGQAVGLLGVCGLFSLQWLIPYLAYAWLVGRSVAPLPALVLSLGLFVAAIPTMLGVGIAAKWLILGRLRPGEYPLWGFTYYRWWLTQRLLETVPIHYLGGSPLLGLYYRLLGARIGSGVILDSGVIDAPDCVAIGHDAAFGSGATLSCCKVEFGRLIVGKIQVGRGCHVGASANVGLNSQMADGAELGDLSMLPANGSIPPGERWGGSPARFIAPVEPGKPLRASPGARAALAGACAVLLFIFPVFAVLPLLPGMLLMAAIGRLSDAASFVRFSPLLAVMFVVSMCLQIAALKWLLVGRLRAGHIPVFSAAYLRHWLMDQLMALSLDVVNPLYATLYLNPWYRLLGVRLGPRAEISTASSICPDLLTIGAESFIADAVSLGAPRIYRGRAAFAPTVIGERTFVGNSAVIPAGTTLGDGVLIGVLSVPPSEPANAQKAGSSWFGTPAVFLPRRQIARQFDEASTFRPRRALVLQRLAIEFGRLILPLTVIISLSSLMIAAAESLAAGKGGLGEAALFFPFIYAAFALAIGIVVVLLKWAVVGRYAPTEKPLWNHFVWRCELVTSTYENLAVPFFADMLRGTPFLPMYARLLGCRIGKRVFMDTTDVTEFDLVRIGDEAALNNDCGPQTHLFEDRVMKIAQVDIGARCTLGAGAIVLYGARMEAGSTLGELSLLMKGEVLPAGTHWEGSPARPAASG